MIKVLVTGSSGFLGSYLIPFLKASYEVSEINRKMGDIKDEATWLKFPKADVVIHLAGMSFVPDSWQKPYLFIECNLMSTIAALNYCRSNNAKLIFVSSYLYGNPHHLPIAENAAIVPKNPYALSKKLSEDACQFYADSFDMDVTILRLFNVYGAGQPECFLIPSIINQVRLGRAIQVKDLEPKRDFVYIKDVIKAIGAAINYFGKPNIFNIGSGLSYSVGELIHLIQGIKQTNLPVYSSLEIRHDEIMNTIADVTLAKEILEWSPEWTINMGLKEMMSFS